MDSVSYKTHPHRGRKKKKISKIKLTYRFNTIFLCCFSVRKKIRVQFCYHSHLSAATDTLKHSYLAGNERKWHRPRMGDLHLSLAFTSRISQLFFKCAHVPRATKHFQKTLSLRKRGTSARTDSYKNMIPGNPEALMRHLFIENLAKGNGHFPPPSRQQEGRGGQ